MRTAGGVSTPGARGTWVGLVLACAAAGAPAQRQDPPGRRAGRLLTFLELPERRSEAVRGLLALGAAAVPTLQRGILDPRPEIAFSCMHLLRELGPAAKPALPALAAIAAGGDAQRANAARWARSRLVPEGITVLANHQRGRLLELGPDGKVRKELGDLKGIWDVEKLPNGNYLVTRYNQAKAITELTPSGKEVWSFADVRMPLDADRLADGNTLIADTYNSRVIEVDPKGRIVWTFQGGKPAGRARKIQPYDADRLPDGNTLVCEYLAGLVYEVDRAGEVVWQTEQDHPIGAQRLPDGNTLVCLNRKGRVVEVNRAGKVVWTVEGLKQPNDAVRLANGNTLVAEQRGAYEFDAKGKEVWRHGTGPFGSVHRY